MSICSAKKQYASYREGVYAIILNCLSIPLKRIIKATSAVCSIDYIHTTFGSKLANVYAIDINNIVLNHTSHKNTHNQYTSIQIYTGTQK